MLPVAKLRFAAGASKLTAGTVLVVTVIDTGTDTLIPPRLSVALALIRCIPAVAPLHDPVNGVVVAVAITLASDKNSTLPMLPSLSVAVAVKVIAWPTVNAWPALGEVTLTAGKVLAAMVMVDEGDVVLVPRLSVARAATVCEPTAIAFQRPLNGGTSAVATMAPSTRNSTLLIVPSASAAVAERPTGCPA